MTEKRGKKVDLFSKEEEKFLNFIASALVKLTIQGKELTSNNEAVEEKKLLKIAL